MSEQRPTPETDANLLRSPEAKLGADYCVDEHFARKLERERDEARRERDALKRNHDIAFCKAGHPFRTIASSPAKSESEWECPNCAVIERNQLRKVADELGRAVCALYDDSSGVKDFHPQYGYLHSYSYHPNSQVDKDLQTSLESYNQLPHVQAGKKETK